LKNIKIEINMKKLIAITLVMLSLALVNCKDNNTDDPEPTKTLYKALLTNKYWKTTSGTVLSHYFRSDGKYCLPDGITEEGTWNWINNSDTMLIDEPSTTGKVKWIAEYCTETELKMKVSGGLDWYIFTKQ
jgi:hypothetical protein